ncbi:hypothetical protein [Nocardia terpenica]|uniref:hypothetical protein n=1 Tax=Nocardia terpenica TaxID=455432 RepID=UPI0018E0A613|nr:hypothetical protein [Nocardia terpenica]
MKGTQYTLRVANDSRNIFDMCVFQEDPNLGVSDVKSLAWFVKTAAPTTVVTFRWTLDYSFIWSETGRLIPGVYFDASQVWPADPNNNEPSSHKYAGNQIHFTREQNAYTFESKEYQGATSGTLYIQQSDSIPHDAASVGIGMSGSGTFGVQAQPSLNLSFTPHPKYYLSAGSFNEGEVLDIGVVTDKVQIDFPSNIYSMNATLNEDNKWDVEPAMHVRAPADKRAIIKRRTALLLNRG